MVFFLRALVALTYFFMLFTALMALEFFNTSMGHISISIFSMIFVIFTQSFIIFYFVGATRLARNVLLAATAEHNPEELTETSSRDFKFYIKESTRIVTEVERFKRQTVSLSILTLVLATLAFLSGAACDTRMVDRTIHSGMVLGYLGAMSIGVFKQWHYLKKAKQAIDQLKTFFDF